MRLITKQAAKLKELEARRERLVNRIAKLDLKIEEQKEKIAQYYMNQQDFDKKKSIPQGKENSLFYKIINRMIISRKALGITHLVYGAIVLCVFAERAEILSSPPSVGSRIFLLLSICFPFVYGTYLLCTKDRNKSERS